jgi:hypothetical protein
MNRKPLFPRSPKSSPFIKHSRLKFNRPTPSDSPSAGHLPQEGCFHIGARAFRLQNERSGRDARVPILNWQPFGLWVTNWIPAFAGMTVKGNDHRLNRTPTNFRHSRESGNPARTFRRGAPQAKLEVSRRKRDGRSGAVESSNADEQETIIPSIAEIQSVHQTFAPEVQPPDSFRLAASPRATSLLREALIGARASRPQNERRGLDTHASGEVPATVESSPSKLTGRDTLAPGEVPAERMRGGWFSRK